MTVILNIVVVYLLLSTTLAGCLTLTLGHRWCMKGTSLSPPPPKKPSSVIILQNSPTLRFVPNSVTFRCFGFVCLVYTTRESVTQDKNIAKLTNENFVTLKNILR